MEQKASMETPLFLRMKDRKKNNHEKVIRYKTTGMRTAFLFPSQCSGPIPGMDCCVRCWERHGPGNSQI